MPNGKANPCSATFENSVSVLYLDTFAVTGNDSSNAYSRAKKIILGEVSGDVYLITTTDVCKFLLI